MNISGNLENGSFGREICSARSQDYLPIREKNVIDDQYYIRKAKKRAFFLNHTLFKAPESMILDVSLSWIF